MALNLLIVDDSSVMRSMILKSLKMSGVEIGDLYQAGNGREGLDALEQHWIDLVIADLNMPVLNGEEMLECMKKNPVTSTIPVLVISTEGSEKRIEHLKSLGARFIRKPFTPEQIRDMITDLTGGQHGAL
jgi:two-component system, chemotaxis family, chemotaxis protein CheY